MQYYNYLTVPSGKKYKLYELNCKNYLTIQKFLNGNNYEGFYEFLDNEISKSINDFDSLDICDKAYIYIAFYYYSVRTTIALKSEQYSSVEIPLTILLNSLENNYIKEENEYIFFNKKCKIFYPRYFNFDDENNISIDYVSSLRKIENIDIKKKKVKQLSELLPLKDLNTLENFVKRYYNNEVTITERIGNMDEIKDTILSPSLFLSIAQIYKESLENYYNMLYLVVHYIKVDMQSILQMTPIELIILYNNFIKDKEKQNEDSKKSKTLPTLNEETLGL